ncbi:fibroblast growth factor receptor-like 1 [Crotalus adamanteus]|uniref:Fibroblast growth factor receptor-like 1 n=1 Tax=Crotalus adamanteus TaxID=8729 RepID=A0AAW1BHA8_CROAD
MWTKDGRTIHSGWTRFRVLQQGLKIKEVESEDAGIYICKATNGFGSMNVNYTLIVIGEFSLLCAGQDWPIQFRGDELGPLSNTAKEQKAMHGFFSYWCPYRKVGLIWFPDPGEVIDMCSTRGDGP